MAKLLLISNDEQICQRLEQGLKRDGYDVTTANQSDQGLELASSESPSLILIDIDVSVTNGLQTIKLLRESSMTQQIPIIAIVDRTIPRQLLTQADFDTYVRKPVSLSNLLVRINVLMDIATTIQKEPKKEPKKEPNKTPRKLSTTSSIVRESNDVQPQTNSTVAYVGVTSVNSQTITKIIQNVGCRYTQIPNSLRTLPNLFKLRPQLIFIDLTMPASTNYELCTDLRQTAVLKETPIILLVDKVGMVDRLRAKRAGASDLICKPIDAQHVLNVVTKYLETA